MESPYVEWLRIENYQCIKSVDVKLTRLHAFIGPNDSGKSSILTAVTHLRQEPGRVLAWIHDAKRGFETNKGWFRGAYPAVGGHENLGAGEEHLDSALSPIQLLRLDPDELRKEVPLIPTGNTLWFSSPRGQGLAALYDALQSRDLDGFLAIRKRFIELFPTVGQLRLVNPTTDKKALGLTLKDGSEVNPNGMSEGMLYWLAFAIIERLAPQAMLLVEEPENGLHPARIADVMRVLREVSGRTQILIATHSPLVINELRPEEVTIVTRSPDTGTVCTSMTATKNFAERSKVYALGELWLSYADGDLEKELVGSALPAAKAG